MGSQDVAADLWTGPSSSLQSSLRRNSEPGGTKTHKLSEEAPVSSHFIYTVTRSSVVVFSDETETFRTFVDEEPGVDEQPVTILPRRLQRQSRRQLVLQEGQRHALLQVVRRGGQTGRQATSTAGTREYHQWTDTRFESPGDSV